MNNQNEELLQLYNLIRCEKCLRFISQYLYKTNRCYHCLIIEQSFRKSRVT